MWENVISVDIKSLGDGKYDAYISTEGSSGAHYPETTAAQIGEYVADLVDCLEEEDSGESYLRGKGYELISADGKSIDRAVYDSKAEAQEAMQRAYDELNQNEPGDEWDEESYCVNGSAVLYNRGENTIIWEIFEIV